MNKPKLKNLFINTGITELTVDDIKNNLRKTTFKDIHDQSNLYEFLHTASSSSGKSGFVTIKRQDKRKYSMGSLKLEGNVKRKISNSPKVKGKSLLKCQGFSLTHGTSRKDWRNFSSFKKNIEGKQKKLVKSKLVKKKSLKLRKQSLRDKETSVKVSPKAGKRIETTRENIASPYGVTPSGSLPSLRNFKKKIDLIATIKYRKSPKPLDN